MFGPNDTFSSSLLAQTFDGSEGEAPCLKMLLPCWVGSRMAAFKLEAFELLQRKTNGDLRGKNEGQRTGKGGDERRR